MRLLPLCLLSMILLTGCRNEPGTEGRPDSTDRQLPPVSGPAPADSSSGGPVVDGATGSGAVTGGSTIPAPPEVRTALVDSVRAFMTAVSTGRRERFWEMLSQRSIEAVGTESGGTKDQIWEAARETLGDLDRPAIRFIGGTSDSVSLLVGRTTYEFVDSLQTDTLDDPVIIHFLRESGEWKAIYPGLLYPERETRRR